MIQSPSHILSFLFIGLFVAGCGNATNGSAGGNKSDRYTPGPALVLQGDVSAYQWLDFSHQAQDLLELPAGTYSFSLSGAPAWLSIISSTGEMIGLPSENTVYQAVQVTAKNLDTNQEYSRNFSIAVQGDPLRDHSWHLRNTGQKAFAATGGIAGEDINVMGVYRNHQVYGQGVRIAVSDSGGEINHDDLHLNIIKGASKDYTRDKDDWVSFPTPSSAHGTAVAGLIAASGWNNIGSTGVAPNAKLAIFQFLESPQSTDILIDQASGDFHIFNYSYGDALGYDTESSKVYLDHLRHQVLNGRQGLGTIYLKAAGNEFVMADDENNISVCGSHNANAPFENEAPWLMVIGAINADGTKASYSNAGSNLWVSAPGGEYGKIEPALITTDLPTCFKGYSKASSIALNPFEYGHSLNPKCDYTSIMNGTSGATPVVSGVVALILEANPNLTWREVKHILAMTARNDLDTGITSYPHPSSYYASCPTLSLSSHTYEHGWVNNKAEVKFHNHFGFGLVDAEKAVALAKDFNYQGCGANEDEVCDKLGWLPMPNFIETNPDFANSTYSNSTPVNIPDNSYIGAERSIVINSGVLDFVETVQVKVSVTHPRSGEVGIELISPQGTKSILLNINNSFLTTNDSNLNMVLTSHAFYGENPTGTWTLKVIDGRSSYTGQLTNWKINLIGHN